MFAKVRESSSIFAKIRWCSPRVAESSLWFEKTHFGSPRSSKVRRFSPSVTKVRQDLLKSAQGRHGSPRFGEVHQGSLRLVEVL